MFLSVLSLKFKEVFKNSQSTTGNLAVSFTDDLLSPRSQLELCGVKYHSWGCWSWLWSDRRVVHEEAGWGPRYTTAVTVCACPPALCACAKDLWVVVLWGWIPALQVSVPHRLKAYVMPTEFFGIKNC